MNHYYDKAKNPKNWWARIVAVVAAFGAVLAGAATYWDYWSKLPNLIDVRRQVGSTISGDDKPLLLSSVDLAAQPAASNANSQKVIVEAVVNKRYVKNCKAQLSFGKANKDGYPEGVPDAENDTASNGFKRFTFEFSGKELPDDGYLRLRCFGDMNESWTPIHAWPAKTENYAVVIGEHNNHTGAGETHLPCGADPVAWVKSAHPEKCKFVTVANLGSADGNHCGYAHFQLRCSTQP